MYDFSNAFKEQIKGLNVQSISAKILTVLNNAFDSIQNQDGKVLISFKEFESNSVLSHIFTVNVDFVQLSKNVLKINNLNSLSIDIIKTCRTKNFDKTLENENYLTIEKYAIQDFVTEVIKDYFKESVTNEKVYTITVSPQDAWLIVNDEKVTTINVT